MHPRLPCVNVVRLAGSGVNDTGRLEVYYNGQWGTVCIDDFDDNDAAVACYMLGFGYVHLKVNVRSSKAVKRITLLTKIQR